MSFLPFVQPKPPNFGYADLNNLKVSFLLLYEGDLW